MSIRALLILLALSLLPASAFSQTTYDWINTAGGNYSTGTNWSPTGPPNSTGIARFNFNNTYNVVFTGNTTASYITSSQGNITFFLNGWTYNLTDPTNSIIA